MSRTRIGLVVILVAAGLVLWLVLRPPRMWLNLTRGVPVTAEVGERLVLENDCRRCHRIDGQGTLKAPNLDGVTERYAQPPHDALLRTWLRSPRGVKPDTAMPAFRLSDTEIEAVIAYLTALDQR